MGVAAAVRLQGFDQVFTSDGIRFRPDGDPYYHALQARRIAMDGEVLWRDPGMNHPYGADVLWPPLFDAAIAGAAWATSPSGPSAERIDAVAALAPVVFGAATVALVAVLGAELFGSGLALAAALLLAVCPAHAVYTMVGRPDQHAAELLLMGGLILAWSRGRRATSSAARWRACGALGLLLAIDFWVWQGSGFHLLVLAVLAGAWHILAPVEDSARRTVPASLALGTACGAVVLALSVGALGPPGALRSGRLAGISGLAPALCAAVALSAGLLALVARRPAGRVLRAAEALGAAAFGLAPFLAFPGLRGGTGTGFAALLRGNPWYEIISEFQPLVGSGLVDLSDEFWKAERIFAALPVAAAFAIPALWRVARDDRPRRFGVSLALGLGAEFVMLALLRQRFELYAALPLVLLAPTGAAALAARLGPARLRGLVAAALLVAAAAPGLFALEALRDDLDPGQEPIARVAQRLSRGIAGMPKPGAVLTNWYRGHHVRWFSGLPVVATPFGTDGGPGALEDLSRFVLASDEASAEAVLAPRGVRWVLLQDLGLELLMASAFFPAEPPAAVRLSAREGGGVAFTPRAATTVGVRLLEGDGTAGPGGPALDGFRLMDEDGDQDTGPVKLFEFVRGARVAVTGAAAGASVEAAVEVTTRLGRKFVFHVGTKADGQGRAMLRLPYATGGNGTSTATLCVVSSGAAIVNVDVPRDAVHSGGTVSVTLR